MTEILPKNSFMRKLGLQNSAVVHKLILSAIVVLVGTTSFGLGRLSRLNQNQGGVVIRAPESSLPLARAVTLSPNNTLSMQATSSLIHNFVSSKNGSKYYPSGCKSASRIKAINQIWFETAEAAQVVGLTLASGCK